MVIDFKLRYVWIGVGGIILAGVLFFGIVFWVILMVDRQAAHYPGAVQLSEHDQMSVFPHFSFKQVTSYRTVDDFVSVYRWYSRGFSLGPEKQAQSQCVHMYETHTEWGLSRIVSVTVCDTPNGRMIFVQRTVELGK